MRYYKLLYDYGQDKHYIGCTAEKTYGVNQYDITKGQIINNWNKDITFVYNPNEGNIPTDFLANSYRWLIVSEKFQKIMEKHIGDLIQYLSVKIFNKESKVALTGYKVANIVSVIDALDLKNSEYDIFEIDENEKTIAVKKYAIKGKEVKGKNIFKLKNETIPIFVSEEFKNLIKTNKLTGFDFLEVVVT